MKKHPRRVLKGGTQRMPPNHPRKFQSVELKTLLFKPAFLFFLVVSGLEWIRECGNAHAVVSIQGLVEVCARYSLGGIERGELKKYRTLQDYLRPSLLKRPQRMAKVG